MGQSQRDRGESGLTVAFFRTESGCLRGGCGDLVRVAGRSVRRRLGGAQYRTVWCSTPADRGRAHRLAVGVRPLSLHASLVSPVGRCGCAAGAALRRPAIRSDRGTLTGRMQCGEGGLPAWSPILTPLLAGRRCVW
jgi:hypothetical protein